MTGWTWDQVRDQLDLPRVFILREVWKDNPPLAITMRLVAEANGVEFKGGQLAASASSNARPAATEEFDPGGMMVQLGQSEPVKYERPRMGVMIE